MKNVFNLHERIKGLRKSKGMTQAQFADLLKVSKSTISGWEIGDIDPIPPDAQTRLGNLASYPECLHWWKGGGLDEQVMLSAAERLLREKGIALPKSKFVHIRPLGKMQRGTASTASQIVLPASLVPNPGSTYYIELEKNSVGEAFAEGDIVVVDSFESQRDPRCPTPFWERLVVVRISAPPDTDPHKPFHWREGIVVGRLQLALVHGVFDRIAWVAQLSLSQDVAGSGPVLVGNWAQPLSPEEVRQLDPPENKELETRILQESADRAFEKLRLYEGSEIVGEVTFIIPAKAKPRFHLFIGADLT